MTVPLITEMEKTELQCLSGDSDKTVMANPGLVLQALYCTPKITTQPH